MNGFNLEYIQKLRIHELRDFARQVGVSSPTTMKKEDLINKIQELIGEDKSETGEQLSNQAPIDFFKLLTSPNSNIINELVAKSTKKIKNDDEDKYGNTLVYKKSSVINPNTPYATNDYISFNLQLSQNDTPFGNDVSEIEGYLDIHPNGYGIVRYNGFVPDSRDAYLTLALIRKYNLKKGDFVRGKVKYILENKPKIMFDIISIDGNADDKNFVSFDDTPYVKYGEEYYLEKFRKFHLAKGERIYIKNMSIEDAVKFGFDIVDENGVNVKLINLKALPEESYKSHQKMQVINCQFNKTEKETVEAVELVVERAKREFESSKPNVVIIYNFSELIRMYNAAVEGFYTYDKFNAKAINQLSNIMCSAKFYDNKKNISLICIDKNDAGEDVKTLINSEFMPLFNKKYDMNEL